MKRIFLSFIVPILMLACGCDTHQSASSEIPNKELEELNREIRRAPEYRALQRRMIDSLTQDLHSLPTDDVSARARVNLRLAEEMLTANADSALEFSNAAVTEARAVDNDSLIIQGELSRLKSLTAAGVFNMAEDQLISLESQPMNVSQRIEFWKNGRQLYAYMYYYVEGHYELAQQFYGRMRAFDDSLLRVLPLHSPLRRFLYGEYLVSRGDFDHARGTLDSLMSEHRVNDHIYGMAAFQLAQVYKNKGDEHNYALYMAKAATSDIRGNISEGLALFNLANWLYQHDDIDRAFHFSNFAMKTATSSRARMRAVNIASSLPMIDESYRRKIDGSHKELIIWLVVALLLINISVVALIMLVRQRKRREAAAQRLKSLSKRQEAHMTNFLALCSTYFHKLNSLTTLVRRKIASGQTDELLKLLKSGRYSQDESEDIFSIFDRSFLELYPDFVEQINTLLRPEEHFTPKEDNSLPVELRIYALVKLGIPESVRIAQILDYSVNTVYTYRNKLRGKAIDREHFDENVRNLGSGIDD